MIDFHSHILPNIDDGSRNIDETYNMIKEAQRAGFDQILLTPHYTENHFETNREETEVWLDVVMQNLHEKNLDAELLLANEIFITDNIMNLLINGKASTINDTSYVLLELPLDTEPDNLYGVISNLQHNKLVPIISHPERYLYIQKEPNLILDLIQQGVLMQVNYGSFIGQYGKKAQFIAEKLLENNMVHFLGTDAHRENTIYRKIPEIIDILEDKIGEDRLLELTTTNPYLAIHNKRIDIRKPIEFEITKQEKVKMFFANLIN